MHTPVKRYRIGFVALIGLLLISLAMNYRLFNQSVEYYRALNATRLDPLGLSLYPLLPEQERSEDTARVVFFGDSRAASWPAPPDLDQYEFINRGIGAQTSIQAWLRFDDHIAPLQPQIVIIQMGINDLTALPLFPEQHDVIIENCKFAIQQIVSLSSELGATVILTTIFPVGAVPLERRPVWSDDITLAVKEVNAYIHSLAADNVLIFDTFALLADSDGVVRQEYAIDTLHLSPAGYDALNQELTMILGTLPSRERSAQ